MVEVIGKAAISELILLFVLLFVIPLLVFLLRRLRAYENQYGPLLKKRGKGKKKKEKIEKEKAPEADQPEEVPDVYPYRMKSFITPPERACLEALSTAFGPDVKIHVKVALWGLVESTDKEPGYHARLTGKYIDFLLCDAATDKAFTAVCFEPGKGKIRKAYDELESICQAAGLHLAFLPMADDYDADELKNLLDIRDIDL